MMIASDGYSVEYIPKNNQIVITLPQTFKTINNTVQMVTNIKTDTVGGRKITTAAIRTTVIFDDGFTYISHKSRYHKDDPLNFSGTLYVNHEVIQEIKEDAIIAHQKAYEKQQGRY